jgi:hypothetical protein
MPADEGTMPKGMGIFQGLPLYQSTPGTRKKMKSAIQHLLFKSGKDHARGRLCHAKAMQCSQSAELQMSLLLFEDLYIG